MSTLPRINSKNSMEPAESDNSSHYELVPKTPPVFLVILLLLW